MWFPCKRGANCGLKRGLAWVRRRALVLQRRQGDREVDERHAGAEVGRERRRRVAGGEEEGEGGRVVDVVLTDTHERPWRGHREHQKRGREGVQLWLWQQDRGN